MTRKLKQRGKGLFVAGLAAALSFGAGQAFAGVTDTQLRDRCTDWCVARYNACLKYGWGNCIEEQRNCLDSCATSS